VEDAVLTVANYSCSYKVFVLEYNQENLVRQRFHLNELRNTFMNLYNRKELDCPDLLTQCQESINASFGNHHLMTRLLKLLEETEWVLSHNDLQFSNILADQHDNIFLLDFEFTQFNYLGYDIGNFLNEWTTHHGEHTFEIK
jgi:thiamine kinase-like enzyme